MGTIKRRTRQQRRMHGANLTQKGRRWSPQAMRLRNVGGQAMWVYAHNESPHRATASKVTNKQRRQRRKTAAASRRRNRA